MKRRGQEEMVGFVLIILLVAVIFIIFLGFYLRKSSSDQRTESGELSQFLDALLEYTTDCSLNNGYSYEKISDLARECNQGAQCSNGKDACLVLKENSKEIIESSWNFGAQSPTKGYNFVINFNETSAPDIRLGENCDLNGNYRGSSKPFQKFSFDLKICI